MTTTSVLLFAQNALALESPVTLRCDPANGSLPMIVSIYLDQHKVHLEIGGAMVDYTDGKTFDDDDNETDSEHRAGCHFKRTEHATFDGNDLKFGFSEKSSNLCGSKDEYGEHDLRSRIEHNYIATIDFRTGYGTFPDEAGSTFPANCSVFESVLKSILGN